MKYDLRCSKCQIVTKRWKYEVEAIKDIATYTCKQCRVIHGRITKTCPICENEFTTIKSEQRTTCSYACSNKHFRTGEDNGNWKPDTYRSTCFLYHKKRCVVCSESKIVEVHHYNNNHADNRVENLIPLCPTHHKYMHSRYVDEISSIVDEYYKAFLQTQT